jgi:hypothetical protein
MLKYSLNDSIVFQLIIQDISGLGVSGAQPVFAVRRLSDNSYLDFRDHAFKTSDWTARTAELSEVNSAFCPGVYELILSAAQFFEDANEYSIEYDPGISDYPMVFDILRIASNVRLSDNIDGESLENIFQIILAMANGRMRNDFPNSGECTFYKQDAVTPLFTVLLTKSERTRV